MREMLFAMEPTFLENWLFARENPNPELIKLHAGLFDKDEEEDDEDEEVNAIYSLVGDTARISMTGPLTQAGPSLWDKLLGFGGTSYRSITGALARAEADPAVKQIVLAVNSPGGDVSGVDQVWQAIKGGSKPCTAENRGMIASAAYWIASAAVKIKATSPSDEQGSIGIAIAAIDDSEYLQNLGIKRVTITSKNAPNKRPDVSTKEGRSILQDRCDALERCFISRICEGRGIKTEHVEENFGRGGLMIAKDPDPANPDALSVRMIDDVVERPRSAPVPQSQVQASETIGLKSVSDPAPVAGRSQEVVMTLEEFLAANPDARAQLDKKLAEAKAEGQSIAQTASKKVGAIMSSDAYMSNKVIRAKAVEALTGALPVESFQTIVSTLDAITEQAKSAAAAKETDAAGETPASSETEKGLLEKAAVLKIDAAAVRASAIANKTPFDKALAAEIEGAEMVLRDKRG
jgi:ClpP class serine protease